MKKKVMFITIALAVIIASVAILAACNPTQTNEDKSFANAEFVGFRQKIVKILKDNGIFVNDIDARQKNTATPSGNNKFSLLSEKTELNDFDKIMVKPEFSVSSDGYDFAIKQVFGVSMKMSLCLGDGISNYFGETSFFDIPVKIGGSYMSVSEDGNVNTVRAYSPFESVDGEIFDKIVLEFQSDKEYTFTSLSLGNGSAMFASGNSDKQFILINKLNENESEILYSPNGREFYFSNKQTEFDACLNVVGNDAFSIDKDKFYSNKDHVRYEFSEEQNQALTDKYFKEIQSDQSTDQRQGVNTITKGGITYADRYFEFQNNTVAVIPDGTEYISKEFIIDDTTNTINSLSIPSSLKGVVQTHDEKTGEELAVPKIVDATELRIEQHCDNSSSSSIKALKSITVANGSPLFKSGTGHLRNTDGIYIYLIDAPVDDYDMSLFSEQASYALARYALLGYTNLCFSATEIDYDFDGEMSVNFHSSLFKNLTTINLKGTYNENNYKYGLSIGVYKDLTVNVDIADSFKFHGLPINFVFVSMNYNRHSVTVNLKGLTCIDEITAQDVSVTVNMGMPKIIYEISEGVRLPNESDGVSYVYVPTSLTEEQAQNFNFAIHTRSGQMELEVSPNSADETFVMPEEAGFDVTAIEIKDSYFTKQITLNSKVKYVICNEIINNDLELVYNGTVAEFEKKVQILCYGKKYEFKVRCSDGTKTYSGTTTIPENELCHVTLLIYNAQNRLLSIEVPAAKGKPFYYDWWIGFSEDIPDGEYIALAHGGGNILAQVQYHYEIRESYETPFMHLASIAYDKKLTGDMTFTIVPFTKIYEPERVTVQVPDFECELDIYWSNSVVNLVEGSAKYKGKALRPDCNGSFTMPEECHFIFYTEDYKTMIEVYIEYHLWLENIINGKVCFGYSAIETHIRNMDDK